MLRYETVTTKQVVASLCDRCGREMLKRACDGEWEERISIAFRGGYNSFFGDGNAVELDLCQHCVRDVLGQWLRITDDGWPKSPPHHAGQDHQRRLHPEHPDVLDAFEREGEVEPRPEREGRLPQVQGPIEGLRRFLEQHPLAPESTANRPTGEDES